ncbi:uncharacterized protein LY79DRAFT_673585 [Colletotrichum navitas]|uniref:Uncharacterized protein n=1 Tax=Colletotrichum navitas TaxID=681940 RepID=A0AAD8PNK5_9PEZI|nr:uncharacterized protein LY79DRAFT_673585 [Colletotrichum navitas]KAK1573490.1 hypothetical protein LY79DRAFT_673585 [Colletotrichum navitas]
MQAVGVAIPRIDIKKIFTHGNGFALADKHQRQNTNMPSAKPPVNRKLQARQVYQFYNAATDEGKQVLEERLKAADPEFKLLKNLG